jgi:hypothetical protein
MALISMFAAVNQSGSSGIPPNAGASSATIPLTPNADALPGGDTAKSIVNGIGFYALLFCLVGLILSAGLWAVGAFSNNYTQSVNGKKGFLICAGAAFAIGMASFGIGWFYDVGHNVSTQP